MLAIAGGKGGCGKTTTTLGLAAALTRRGFDPLVIDGDCDMPDVHHRLGLPRRNGVDLLADGARIQNTAVYSEQIPGVAFVTGGRRDSLDTALRRTGSWNGPVLVDCSAGSNRDSLRPLRYADQAIVVSTETPQCLEDAALTRTIAARLSTPPAGTLIRESPTEQRGGANNTMTGRWNILGHLPYVEKPLENPKSRACFERVATSLVESQQSTRSQAPANTETHSMHNL
ncbi:MinD/ParA family protein [Halovenus rubra]|uniref:MinD/ParA family protein n=2 Tax=Halovenus rubra TaxID=869890 RepID=A0ABD5X620_9EURY|nr:AAA family ATPase [Halovenus rubra]